MSTNKEYIVSQISRAELLLKNKRNEITKKEQNIEDLYAFLDKYQKAVFEANSHHTERKSKVSNCVVNKEKSKIFTTYSSKMEEMLTGNESSTVFQGMDTGLNEINQTIQKHELEREDLKKEAHQLENNIDDLYYQLNSIPDEEEGEKNG